MKIRTASLLTVIVFVLPIILSLVYKIAAPFAIGPMVLFYSLVGALVATAAWDYSLSKLRDAEFGALLIVVSPLTFFVLLNYFVVLTYLLGVMDYNLM